MALKGTLKDFSVADIFQLIGQQSKSGSLYVKTGEKEAHIIFDQGNVVLGTFRRSHEDFLLGTMLLRAGVITSEQLAEAIQTQKATRRSLGDILKSMGTISSQVLAEFVTLQLQEVLFILFQWKDGLYEFVPGTFKYNRKFITPQRAEGVLMDGFRMLDEWPRIKDQIGSVETVFQVLTDAASLEASSGDENLDDELDDAFAEFDGDDEPKAQKKNESPSGYSSEEIKILKLIDGRRSLQEVIYLSRMGTFETCKIVSDLLQKGAVEALDSFSQTRVETLQYMKQSFTFGDWLTANLKTIIVLFVFGLATPLLLFGVDSHFRRSYEVRNMESIYNESISFEDLRFLNQRAQIKTMLDIFHLENGSYPTMLQELSELDDPEKWDYRRVNSTYEVVGVPLFEK